MLIRAQRALPRMATVYFDITQLSYNFMGATGPVKQSALVSSVITVKVDPPPAVELSTRTERRRLPC